jgi:hypothetical protein
MFAGDLAAACQAASGPAVRAIGSLERGKPFTTARPDRQFSPCCGAHASDAGRWLPIISAGVHLCDLGGCE